MKDLKTWINSKSSVVILIVLTLGLPALLDRGRAQLEGFKGISSSARHDFDGRWLDELKETRPDFLFLGNSTVKQWIDKDYLDKKLAPKKTHLISISGSGSATWYIIFRHQILASGVRPDRLFILFEDQLLTSPRVYLTRDCLRWIGSDDPVLDQILGGVPISWQDKALYRLEWVYPVQKRHKAVAKSLNDFSLLSFQVVGEERGILQDQINELYRPESMRRSTEIQRSFAVTDVSRNDFDYWLPRSFLPAMIAMARENDIPLCFIRIKTRPDEETGLTEQTPELREYIRRLGDYLHEQDCLFVDFTEDTEIDLSWYGVKDYLNDEHMPLFADKLLKAVPEAFQ